MALLTRYIVIILSLCLREKLLGTFFTQENTARNLNYFRPSKFHVQIIHVTCSSRGECMPTLIKIQCYVCRDMLSTIIPSLKV